MPFIIAGIVIAAYVLSPPPVATGLYPGGTSPWAGCGVPRYPTAEDFRDCQEWQREKRAQREADKAP